MYTLLVSPAGTATLMGDVALSVSGLPADVKATLSPPSVAAGSAATTVTLTLAKSGSSSAQPMSKPGLKAAVPMVLAFMLLPFAGRMRRTGRRLERMVCLLLLCAGAIAVSVGATGCGGVFPQRNYQVTIAATSGSLTLTTTVPLIVQ
jgi:hypothetical protein